jgi:SAM-dependent methyltransferase
MTPTDLLDAAYVGFDGGDLLKATSDPREAGASEWLENGEWLSLAKAIGAERVFFVKNNPVIIFAQHDGRDMEAVRRFFNHTWCMSRPRLLFLALPGELRILDLAEPPIRFGEANPLEGHRLLDKATSIREVQSIVKKYHQESIETGRLFEESRFDTGKDRADQTLINDLRIVRARLLEVDGQLKARHAHALIGRSIFIRYLEDRKVLTQQYFKNEVAAGRRSWLDILESEPPTPYADPQMEELCYPKVLSDKEFTYALFRRLSLDFNGDMFPSDPEEEAAVSQEHLDLLQSFLTGNLDEQQKLFFFAYRFETIPMELISSIYEEFYNVENGRKGNGGSYYTPAALVEFLLTQVLTEDRLESEPRVMDLACGSGIFLVQAFKRIVRHLVARQCGDPPTRQQLLQILQNQIVGIDINEEAVRIAAFSLYLAFLHYQDPPDVRHNKRLPNLILVPGSEDDTGRHLGILVPANSFSSDTQRGSPPLPHRYQTECADVVVGNPPWGSLNAGDGHDTSADVIQQWCHRRGYEVGYKECCQAFIHRAISLLRDGGAAALLVPTGVFFKEGRKSQKFRKQWLSKTTLRRVVNFAHVRDVFFANAIAPFASVVFEKGNPRESDHVFEYWSAKKTAMAKRLRAVVLSRGDVKLVQQERIMRDDFLWKVYWWGGHLDEALINAMQIHPPLGEVKVNGERLVIGMGRGFQHGPKLKQSSLGSLTRYQELPTDLLHRYGPLERSTLIQVPSTVHRRGRLSVYDGLRILVKRGIAQGHGRNGQVVARLETSPLCFRNSVFGIRLRDSAVEEAKMLLGILWSSLTRYYLFLTSSSWGMWHHELTEEALRTIPICLPSDCSLRGRIVDIVDQLMSIDFPVERIEELESDLDAAVFDLYSLDEPERDLIRDMCETGLDLFYNHAESIATKPVQWRAGARTYGTAEDLPTTSDTETGLEGFISTFLHLWNRELEPDGEFRWQVISVDASNPTIAVVFSTQYKNHPLPPPPTHLDGNLFEALNKVSESLVHEFYGREVFIDGLVRGVSDNEVLLIKRNERRFWTHTAAREDAEATMLQAINVQRLRECAHETA